MKNEAPTGLRPGHLLPTLRRERNPSEAKISSLSSPDLRSRFFAKGDKNNLVVWFFLTILYFTTRLVNLKLIPIFTDEAIYARWAQIALHDPVNRFISLEDGKQPLFIWLAAIAQKFISDPLIATR